MLLENTKACGSFGTGRGGRNRFLWCLLCVALVSGMGSVASLDAQVLQASYPYATDLVDSTGNFGDTVLAGDPPPAPPAVDSPLCVNGIYPNSPGGQDVRTPAISTLDTSDFQIDIEFNLTELPTSYFPVIMGGDMWRWIGLIIDSSGNVGAKFNNSNYTWSSTTVVPGTWYAGQIRYDAGTLQIYLDGVFIHDAVIGALTTGGDLDFTTCDYSAARTLNGCIRNLGISNDSTVPVEIQRFSVE